MKKIRYMFMTATLSTFLLSGITTPLYAATFQQESAISLNSGSQISGHLASKADVKYYKVTTQKASGIYISFEKVNAPIEAQLLDENGSQVAYINTPFLKNQKIEASVPAGTYYIRVRAYNWNNSYDTGTFLIKTTYTASQDPAGNANVAPIETKENASLISSGSSYQATLTSDVDVNYFKVVSKADGDLYIRLENLSAPLQIQVLDENNNQVSSVNTNSTKNQSIEAKVQSETYYIKVVSYGWNDSATNGSYSIMASYPTDKVVHNDQFEPNDILKSAYHIHSGAEYTKLLSSIIDRDYYRIEMNQDGLLNLDFHNVGNSLFTQLLDESGKVIELSYANVINPIVLKKGTYYVKVSPYGWDDNTKTSYTFKATFPEDNTIKVNVNGRRLSFDQPPIIANGRTLVPLRGIVEALGATINWNNSKVSVIKGDDKIVLTIGSNGAYINGKAVSLDAPAEIVNGRTMVPLRFLGQAMNINVDWDGENQTVNVIVK